MGEGRGSVMVLAVMLLLTACFIPTTSGLETDELPSAPLDLTAVPGNGLVILTWNPPQYSNGSAIVEYWIYRNVSGAPELRITLGNVNTYTDTGLANGQEYRYSLQAVNRQGAGNISEEVAVTPRTVPFAPLDPRAGPGDRFLNLSWTIPIWDGGAPILGYTVYSLDPLVSLGTTSEPYFIHSLLEPLSTHSYLVAAFNQAGEGERSVPFSGTADTVPGVPSNIKLEGGANNVTLTWEPPMDNGGSGPSGYRIYRGNSTDNITLLLALSDELNQYVDYGLEENGTYWYQISSFNLVGESDPTVPIPVNVSANAELRISSIVEGDRTVELFWELGERWSSQVIRYWIYRGDSPQNLTLLRSDLWVTRFEDVGLTNGQRYYYQVAAQTAAGLGWSQNVSAVPHRVPYAPSNLTAEGRDGYILLDWQPPTDDGGYAVLGYKVYMGEDGSTPSYLADVNDTSFLCAGLTSGEIYIFQVSAVNSAGEGDLSAEVQEMCGKVPTAPTSIKESSGQGYVHLTWSPPVDPGSVPVQMYEVSRTNDNSTLVLTFRDLYWNDTSVVNGVTYEYKVRAINQVGEGPWSEMVTGVPAWRGGPPGRPLNLNATCGQDYISLTWDAPFDGGQTIDGYLLFRGLAPDMMFYMTTVQQGAYNDTDLPLGNTYYYKVVARNVIGQGPESEVVNGTTVAPIRTENKDIWDVLFTEALPLTTVMILAVIAISLLIGRRYIRRKDKDEKKKGGSKPVKKKAGTTARPPEPPKGAEPKGKEKDKGGRWD